MKSIKRFAKRSLSLILCLAMVMTTMFFFDIGITKPEAAVTEDGRVAFYVPEVIYLTPSLSSPANFQYYIQDGPKEVNNFWEGVSDTLSTATNSTGSIYFSDEKGYTDPKLEWRFVNESLSGLSGGSVSITNEAKNTPYFNTTFYSATISGGTSPTLDASTQGCYIEWTMNYTNSEGERQAAVAYTYVYKTFAQPVGAATKAMAAWHNVWTSSMLWVVGVHGYVNGDNGYTAYTQTNNFSPMLGIITNPAGGNNDIDSIWISGTDNGLGATIGYDNIEASGTNTMARSNAISPTATLIVDTSRYNNFNQIPNFKIGFMSTNRKNTGAADSWYICDYGTSKALGTDSYSHGHSSSGTQGKYNPDWEDYGSPGTNIATGEIADTGILYNATWNKTISGTSSFRIKSALGGYRTKNLVTAASKSFNFVNISVTGVNKSTLRTAVYNAIKSFGTLGVKDDFGSYHYDANSTAWKDFVNAYKNACKALTRLDSSENFANLASTLNNAVTKLKSGTNRRIFFNVNYDGINPNLYIQGSVKDGGYGLTATYNADESITLDGTISGSNAFGTTPFNPYVGNNTYSVTVVSGSMSGGGCVVLDAGKRDTNNITTRTNFDFTGTTHSTKNFSTTSAEETELLRFWQWQNGAAPDATYNKFTFHIKVEKGSIKTAYSPAARIATDSGTYGTLPTPERVGYTLEGWYTDAACTNKVTKDSQVTSDVLYAKWVGNSEIMFGNEFNFEKEFADIDDDEVIIDHIANSVTMTAKPIEGQENDEKQTGFLAPLVLIPGHSYRVTSDLTVIDDSDGATDKASGQVHICFTPNGAPAELEESKLNDHYNDPLYYLDAKSSTVAEGNVTTLNGVFTVPDGKPYVHLNFDVNLAEGGDVTGKITNIYVYDITSPEGVADDLSEPKDSNGNKLIFVSGTPGDTITEFSVPKRSGYNFVGWSTERDATTGVANPDKKVDAPYKLPVGVTTLYSLWEPKTYTIKFDPNGGEGTMADFTVYYDEPANLPANTLTRENCIFKGWSVSPMAGYGGIYADQGLVNVKNLYPDENNVITLYAQWDIEGEVIFGNEFDFDRYVWRNFSHSTGFVDYALNTVTLTSETSDAYTNDYDRSDQSGMMNLIPGRTYEFSCVAKNLTEEDKTVKAQMYLFTFESENLDEENIGSNGVDFTDATVDLAKGATGTISKTLTLDEGNKYATIRVGIRTADATVEFSEICVRDITNFASEPETDSVTKADPSSINYEPGTTVDLTAEGIPTLTRPGYTFAGWSKTKNMTTGNGEEVINSLTMPEELSVKVNNVTLYPVWQAKFIIVRMNLYSSTVDQEFFFGEKQALKEVTDAPPSTTVEFYDGDTLKEKLFIGTKFDFWSEAVNGAKLYDDAQEVTNPGGVELYTSGSNRVYELYSNWTVAENSDITAPFIEKENASGEYVLKGWAETKGSTTVKYKVNDKFVPEDNMSLYAVWHKLEDTDNKVADFVKDYKGEQEVVSGIVIGADGVAKAEKIIEVLGVYDTKDFDNAKSEYDAAKNAYESNKNAATNNALLGAIGNVESSAAKVPSSNGSETKYLDNFEIKYAEGVEGAVPAGKYSVADMNLNHYTTDDLEDVRTEWGTAQTYTRSTNQVTINESVVKMATVFANKQDVKTSTPTYNVYDTAESIKESGLTTSTDITAMNYVYTGKDNYTYYCYTNSKNPVMYVTVDEVLADANDRICYPTTVDTASTVVTSTAGAIAAMPDYGKVEDTASKDRYQTYLKAGLGTAYADRYSEKAVIELRPDFSKINADVDRATVKYTFKAYDDAYAKVKETYLANCDLNFADSAKLASGAAKGNLETIPDTVQTAANEITIYINYHTGDKMNVTAEQVDADKWLKQFHLFRTSGGASNYEWPAAGDSVYTVDDNTYGQADFGSFTYTFEVGATNNFANCVLSSATKEDVIATVKEHYDEMKAVSFVGANKANGTGLGFKVWTGTGWSYNYYPKSNSYTYVHLVDRWGNTFDGVFKVPNLDYIQSQIKGTAAGSATVLEQGGSGIDTMSFSAQSFEIITDENSIFTGESYTTSGNTIKVYTGEANKQYTLEANDAATNKTTAKVATDAEGYLTITVEDEAFDTQTGAYTFSLNGMEINLYAEVERNIISATSEPVEKGQTAIVEIVTTSKVETVQLVSETGTTTTKSEYTEDEDGNRVWTIRKNKEVGEYEYKIRFKAEGRWTTEGDKVTVTVTEPIFFVGAVTNVEYTPSTSTRNDFKFTVTGRPDKIQIIEPSGGTRTYDRYHVKVIIVSYDAEGNEVGTMSREHSYEVWTIVEMNVPADMELTAVAKYGKTWSKEAPYKYTVILATPEFDDEVYSMSLERTEGRKGKVKATVVTGLDVQGVRFVMEDTSTTTYYTAVSETDGKKTFVGNAWMNHEGENIIVVKIRVNNAWLKAGELNYNVI